MRRRSTGCRSIGASILPPAVMTPTHTAWYSRWILAGGERLGKRRARGFAAGDDQDAPTCPCRGDGRCRRAAASRGAASYASSAFCSVRSGFPAPGCTTRPAGLSTTRTSASSQATTSGECLRDVRDGVLVGRVELDALAAGDDVAWPQHAAIDAQHSVVDPALQARARELRQGVGQRLVEAPPGRLRRQAQFALVTGGTHAGRERSFAGILR